MKGMKILLMLMMICGSTLTFAEGDAATAGTGEHTNSCGPNSTCGECVVQGTGSETSAEDVIKTDGQGGVRGF